VGLGKLKLSNCGEDSREYCGVLGKGEPGGVPGLRAPTGVPALAEPEEAGAVGAELGFLTAYKKANMLACTHARKAARTESCTHGKLHARKARKAAKLHARKARKAARTHLFELLLDAFHVGKVRGWVPGLVAIDVEESIDGCPERVGLLALFVLVVHRGDNTHILLLRYSMLSAMKQKPRRNAHLLDTSLSLHRSRA